MVLESLARQRALAALLTGETVPEALRKEWARAGLTAGTIAQERGTGAAAAADASGAEGAAETPSAGWDAGENDAARALDRAVRLALSPLAVNGQEAGVQAALRAPSGMAIAHGRFFAAAPESGRADAPQSGTQPGWSAASRPGAPDMAAISRFFERDARRYG